MLAHAPSNTAHVLRVRFWHRAGVGARAVDVGNSATPSSSGSHQAAAVDSEDGSSSEDSDESTGGAMAIAATPPPFVVARPTDSPQGETAQQRRRRIEIEERSRQEASIRLPQTCLPSATIPPSKDIFCRKNTLILKCALTIVAQSIG